MGMNDTVIEVLAIGGLILVWVGVVVVVYKSANVFYKRVPQRVCDSVDDALRSVVLWVLATLFKIAPLVIAWILIPHPIMHILLVAVAVWLGFRIFWGMSAALEGSDD
jgi:hypothetical protein